MANSAAIMALPDSHFDIIRPGIALYGIYPSDTMDKSVISLKPAMSIKAHIVYLKKVPQGTPISYGHRFVTERESLIATLPVGYEDGLPRNTHNKARILVRGRYAPIVGTVCMDLCMADVTDVPGVQEYDEVTLIGEQDGKRITAEEIAEFSDTNAYEVVCRFGLRMPRRYI
jgi:alanine racemase